MNVPLRKCLVLICLLCLPATAPLRSQQTQTNTPPRVIEVTTSLVEVDAVVTDSRGRPATNLTADDFLILQDGKPQKITAFSHVSAGRPAGPNSGAARQLEREEVKRTIAFVIDDVRLDWDIGFRTFQYLQRTLPELVERNLREGDLAGLFYLSRPQGLEQYTTDRELLKTLAAGLKYLPGGMQTSDVHDVDDPDSPIEFSRRDEAERMEELALRGLGSLIEEMKGMPGRKSVLFLSTGINTPQNLSRLIDQAKNAGVTIYPIDPREREPDPTTIDQVNTRGVIIDPPPPPEPPSDRPTKGLFDYRKSRLANSLTVLATETGGKGYGREEELDKRVVGALQDQESYYVLGYSPEAASFDRKTHTIEVKLVNGDLRVRSSRSVFAGQPDHSPSPKTSGDVMSDLLSSPYRNSGVRAALSTFFTAAAGKSALNSAVFVDGHDLRAEQTANGKFRGGVELRAVAIDPKGRRSGEVGRIARFEMDGDAWRRIQETGMVYKLPATGESPGPYQMRVALRDIVSGATGTASTFLVVPDLKKGKLTLSDVLLSAPASVPNPHPLSNIAARSFVRGGEMEWTVEVYNVAAGDKKKGGGPKLQKSVRVLRSGNLVQEIPFEAAAVQKKEGTADFALKGLLGIGNLATGDYVLQLLVRDLNEKNAQVSRFTDFHILP